MPKWRQNDHPKPNPGRSENDRQKPEAEGHQSRADVLENAAEKMDRLQSFQDQATGDYRKVYDFAETLSVEVRHEYFRPGGYLVPSLINYCRRLQSGS